MEQSSLDRYQFIALLGHGGMADVYLAVRKGLSGFNKLTVVKRVREHLATEQEFVDMLLDEARISARLNHPNVVQVNEIGEVDGRLFLAMEYLDGQPLSRVQRVAPKDDTWLALYVYILSEVCAGLHYAHDLVDYDGTPLEIVHRDVTPQNVFVTYEGQVKVLDFGIARAANRSVETREGVIKGKIRYMAPEQALGVRVDRRADVFAVGVMLWEAITGQRLWGGRDDVEIVRILIEETPLPLASSVAEDVPARLDAICAKALALRPENRYQSALELRSDLEEWLTSEGKLGTVRASLGNEVATLFADRRREIAAVIEKQIAALRAEPEVSLARIDPSSPLLPVNDTPASAPASTAIPAIEAATRTDAGVRRSRGKRLVFGVIAAAAAAVVIGGVALHTAQREPVRQASAAEAAPAMSAPAVVAPPEATPAAPPSASSHDESPKVVARPSTTTSRPAIPTKRFVAPSAASPAHTATASAPAPAPTTTAASTATSTSDRLERRKRPLESGDPWEGK